MKLLYCQAVVKRQNNQPKPELLIISGIILLAILVLLIVFWRPLLHLFENPLHTREVIASAGPWGPIVFIGMQILQVVAAPIPGQVTGFVGGFVFGAIEGTIYSMIGSIIGSALVFLLARKLGRPFVDRFVSSDIIKKFDYLAHKHGAIVLFFIFLLPLFPDDAICYLVGLTKMRLRTFLVVTSIGRLPSMFALSLAASGLAEAKIHQVIAVVVVCVVIAAVAYWQRKHIEAYIRKLGD